MENREVDLKKIMAIKEKIDKENKQEEDLLKTKYKDNKIPRVINAFMKYHSSKQAFAKAKNESEAEFYENIIYKFYSKMQTYLKLLDDNEMTSFMNEVMIMLTEMAKQSDEKLIEARMLLETILNHIPKKLSEDNQVLLQQLMGLRDNELDYMK